MAQASGRRFTARCRGAQPAGDGAQRGEATSRGDRGVSLIAADRASAGFHAAQPGGCARWDRRACSGPMRSSATSRQESSIPASLAARLAVICYSVKDFDRARRLSDQALASGHGVGRASDLKAKLMIDAGDFDGAEALIRNNASGRTSASGWLNLAMMNRLEPAAEIGDPGAGGRRVRARAMSAAARCLRSTIC